MPENKKLICITGTNASGKSGLAVDVAQHYNAEIVSADSRQVFRGLDLGSGKITAEEMKNIPHHMLDVVGVNEFYSLSDYQKQAYGCIDGIIERDHLPFLVGGTGLYINAVVDGYTLTNSAPDMELRRTLEGKTIEELIEIIRGIDESALGQVACDNKRRLERAAEKLIAGVPLNLPSNPRYDTLVLGVTWDRQVLHKRIDERLDRRLRQGMIEEVEELIRQGATDEFLYKLGLEYRYILWYLRGKYETKQEFTDELARAIKKLAKEQMTWFRKRSDITWLDMEHEPEAEACRLIDRFLSNNNLFFSIDRKNYREDGSVFKRIAARAIIEKDGKYALVRGEKYGDCKLPGGGAEPGECLEDTLVREVREETGLIVKRETIKYVGRTEEKEKGDSEDIFSMISHFFTCEVEAHQTTAELHDYEIEYGYRLVYMTATEAREQNERLSSDGNIRWLEREIRFFRLLEGGST